MMSLTKCQGPLLDINLKINLDLRSKAKINDPSFSSSDTANNK